MAARWTVMLYMAADRAGLECPSLRKFLDLAAAGSGSTVNFLVRLSRPPQHQDGCPGSEAERWSGIRTYRLRAGTTLASPDEFRASDGDIRSARNLEEFVSWSLEQCPSQYTMLIFVGDHVDFSGPVADPLADGTPLSEEKIVTALENALNGRRLDIVAFDACRKAGIETAFPLRRIARYLVASEDDIPDTAWSYRDGPAGLARHPEFAPATVAGKLVERYQTSSGAPLGNWPMLSALDLTKVLEVEDRLSRLAQAMISGMAAGAAFQREIAAIRSGLLDYASDPDSPARSVDLHRFLEALLDQEATPGVLRARAAGVLEALDSGFVLANWTSEDGSRGARGLSIYFPPGGPAVPAGLPAQCGNEFGRTNAWAEFLAAYLT